MPALARTQGPVSPARARASLRASVAWLAENGDGAVSLCDFVSLDRCAVC